MSRLDWDKARRRELATGPAPRPRPDLRRLAMDEFARTHGLACFKCGARHNPWAKTGVSKRGPWAICVPCVESGTKKKRPSSRAAGTNPRAKGKNPRAKGTNPRKRQLAAENDDLHARQAATWARKKAAAERQLELGRRRIENGETGRSRR